MRAHTIECCDVVKWILIAKVVYETLSIVVSINEWKITFLLLSFSIFPIFAAFCLIVFNPNCSTLFRGRLECPLDKTQGQDTNSCPQPQKNLSNTMWTRLNQITLFFQLMAQNTLFYHKINQKKNCRCSSLSSTLLVHPQITIYTKIIN